MTEQSAIIQRVNQALKNAVQENECDFSSWELDHICVDLLDCDADLEGLEVDQIRPYVKAWFDHNTTIKLAY